MKFDFEIGKNKNKDTKKRKFQNEKIGNEERKKEIQKETKR